MKTTMSGVSPLSKTSFRISAKNDLLIGTCTYSARIQEPQLCIVMHLIDNVLVYISSKFPLQNKFGLEFITVQI